MAIDILESNLSISNGNTKYKQVPKSNFRMVKFEYSEFDPRYLGFRTFTFSDKSRLCGTLYHTDQIYPFRQVLDTVTSTVGVQMLRSKIRFLT